MKKDKYFRDRGGKAKIVDVVCAKCGQTVITYQKDGFGLSLKRCYLNRIIAPEKWSEVQNKANLDYKDLEQLICDCGVLIGSPMKHRDGRIAFRLLKGKYSRKINKDY